MTNINMRNSILSVKIVGIGVLHEEMGIFRYDEGRKTGMNKNNIKISSGTHRSKQTGTLHVPKSVLYCSAFLSPS